MCVSDRHDMMFAVKVALNMNTGRKATSVEKKGSEKLQDVQGILRLSRCGYACRIHEQIRVEKVVGGTVNINREILAIGLHISIRGIWYLYCVLRITVLKSIASQQSFVISKG